MAVETYLRHRLALQLAVYGLTDDQIARVADDIGRRLTSLLSRWNDPSFRGPILLIGREEATFYEPTWADLDVRSLVVVAVRNSLLENLTSTPEAARQIGVSAPVIPDRDVRTITAAAIEHFAGLDLARVGRAVPRPAPRDDVFGYLPPRHPVTWAALTQLAALERGERAYPPVASVAPRIDLGRPVLGTSREESNREHVLSGMERAIEPRLQRILRLVTNGVVPLFFADSFKMITRNPEKLFPVIELVLCHGRPVVTHNYYLRNGHVARRDPLLRPAHAVPEARAKFQHPCGLTDLHRRALREIAAFL